MSMMSCEECGHLIDTDFSPESFREEFNDRCLCEVCYEEMLEDLDESRETAPEAVREGNGSSQSTGTA